MNLQQIFETYEIGKELGSGGFATVFQGIRLSDQNEVAIKYVGVIQYAFGLIRIHSRKYELRMLRQVFASSERMLSVMLLEC